MKIFAKIVLILIISGNWALQPARAYKAYENNCPCCDNNISIYETACNCLSEQSLNNIGDNIRTKDCGFKQCNDRTTGQKTAEIFLLPTSSPELKKKPTIFISQAVLPYDTLVLCADTETNLYSQHLLSSESLFLFNKSLRM